MILPLGYEQDSIVVPAKINLSSERQPIEPLLLDSIPINKMFEVLIVGGGEAGCHAAIALAKMKNSSGYPCYKITLIEKNKELMRGTSRITPGRLGEGYHYNHLETALNYLQETMSFMQYYPKCVVGKDLGKSHPLRRGRYVVMKNSNPEPSKVWGIYKSLQKAYEDRVKENPNNKIWGETTDFLKLIYISEDQNWLSDDSIATFYSRNRENRDELKKVINLENVAFVVETAEELLDWKQYREHVLNELAHYDNITVFTEMEAVSLVHRVGQNFAIQCKNLKHQTICFYADFPVICAWERSDRLINTLNITSTTTEKTTNRLKSIITIKLPSNMLNSHSYFFCMGPYAMFCNMGDGLGKITYAPITNMQKIDASEEIPQEMACFLSGQASPTQKRSIAEKILTGSKEFIPALASVIPDDIIDIDFGIVKTRGTAQEIDIYDPLGKIGERDYGWVRKHEVDNGEAIVIQNDAMKIVYSLKNAIETTRMINEAAYQQLLKSTH